MATTNNLTLLGGVAVVLFAAFFIIGYTGRQLAQQHGSDVRVVWYLFSLALTCTLLVAHWASSVGAIDAAGRFHGTTGEVIRKLLQFMLDLEADLRMFGTLVALVVIPQLLVTCSAASSAAQLLRSWSAPPFASSSGAFSNPSLSRPGSSLS
jgi:hypothetical protein